MKDMLPPQLMRLLRDRILAGVADAEAMFAQHSSDEDSVTGALGQSLAMPAPMLYHHGRDTYSININYRKIRGRGAGAPEKRYGTDGIFQIEVIGKSGLRRKGLPFQAKVGWKRSSKQLAMQAWKLHEKFSSSIVIDYSAKGYSAAHTKYVYVHNGQRKAVEAAGGIKALGQVLAYDFLNCDIGEQGLYYDPPIETFLRWHEDIPVRNLLTTTIKLVEG